MLQSLLYERCANLFLEDTPFEEPKAQILIEEFNQKFNEQGDLFASELLDVIWLLDTELSEYTLSLSKPLSSFTEEESLNANSNETTSSYHQTNLMHLSKLVRTLFDHGILSMSLLLERLEGSLLEAAGLLSSAALLNKKIVRLNTSMLYRQQRYNLLREETEGFAKLATILFSSPPFTTGEDKLNDPNYNACRLQNHNASYLQNLESTSTSGPVQFAKSLIGYFDLDPCRVIAMAVDSIENESSAGVALIKSLAISKHTIAEIIGFKITGIYQSGLNSSEDEKKSRLCSLSDACAILLKENLVEFDHIYSIFTTASTSKADEESLSVNLHQLVTDIKSKTIENSTTPGEDVSTTLPSSPNIANEILFISKNHIFHPKIYLTSSLLSFSCVTDAIKIVTRFPLLVLLPSVAEGLCHALRVLIESVTENSEDISKLLDFESFKCLLRMLGPCVYVDPSLVSLLCRVLIHFPDKEYVSIVLVVNILPALAIMPANVPAAHEVWHCLLFNQPYNVRYSIYSTCSKIYLDKNESSIANLFPDKSVMVIVDRAQWRMRSEVKRVLRRLTRENARLYGRLLGKMSCGLGEWVLFPLVLEQLMAYDNLIAPMVDSLRFLTPLAFDRLIFCILNVLLTCQKERLKQDGMNISQWLSGLAVFTACLFKKYHIDVAPVISYIGHALIAPFKKSIENISPVIFSKKSCVDLVLMKELLSRMGKVEPLVNVSNSHLEALAGGPILLDCFSSGANLSNVNDSKSLSDVRLLEALISGGLAVPLWIALAQQRSASVFTGDLENTLEWEVKSAATLLDEVQSVFMQFTTFIGIGTALKSKYRDSIRAVLPSPTQLCEKYKISLDYVAAIWRAVDKKFTEDTLAIEYFSGSSRFERKHISEMKLLEASNDIKSVFGLFWSSELSDISFPSTRYLGETIRLRTLLLTQTQDQSILEQLSKLEAEMHSRDLHARAFKDKLNRIICKLVDSSVEFKTYARIMVDNCLLPRSILSPPDAVFSGLFAHAHCTSALSRGNGDACLSAIVARFLDHMQALLLALTESEAQNLGRLLESILPFQISLEVKNQSNEFMDAPLNQQNSTVMTVEKDEKIENSCMEGDINIKNMTDVEPDLNLSNVEKNGAVSSVRDSVTINKIIDEVEQGEITFESKNGPTLTHLHSIFTSALESDDYLQRKNSIIIFTRLADFYPVSLENGLQLETLISRIRVEETREDVKLTAARYAAILTASRSRWGGRENTEPNTNPKIVNIDFENLKSDKFSLSQHENTLPDQATTIEMNDVKEESTQVNIRNFKTIKNTEKISQSEILDKSHMAPNSTLRVSINSDHGKLESKKLISQSERKYSTTSGNNAVTKSIDKKTNTKVGSENSVLEDEMSRKDYSWGSTRAQINSSRESSLGLKRPLLSVEMKISDRKSDDGDRVYEKRNRNDRKEYSTVFKSDQIPASLRHDDRNSDFKKEDQKMKKDIENGKKNSSRRELSESVESMTAALSIGNDSGQTTTSNTTRTRPKSHLTAYSTMKENHESKRKSSSPVLVTRGNTRRREYNFEAAKETSEESFLPAIPTGEPPQDHRRGSDTEARQRIPDGSRGTHRQSRSSMGRRW